MDTLTGHNEIADSEAQPNKRRRKKSIVWEHFTIETIDADCTKACCKQCKKSFAYISGSKLAGTSHLKRHIALGICPASRMNQDKNQLTSNNSAAQTNGSAVKSRKRYRATPVPSSIPFDQARCCYDIARMIIQHDYPLEMVEHSGFNKFVRNLQPLFSSVSVDTIQEHIFNIYLSEKQSLLNIIGAIPGRVSLTLDLRISDQNLGYVFLTGYFVDCDWKLRCRLLNVIMVPFPDSDVAFNHAVAACLTDWCLETKLFTLTLDHSVANVNVRKNLGHLLSIKGGNILNGQLIIGSCCARVLSHLAQDALDSTRAIVEKVRQSVKFVKTADAHEEKFLELKRQLQVPSAKELIVDDQTKWDTTYQMLITASELKEVFSCLDTSDPDYKVTPTMDEWKQVEILCAYLKLFFDAANILTSPTYSTADVLFHEVWKIQLDLMQAARGQDHFVRNLTKPLHEKFDKYWNDCNLVLAVAVVMDPRFKMKIVEFTFNKIYGEEAESWIKIVDEGVHEVFCDYIVQSLPPPPASFVDEANDNFVIKSEFSHEDGFLPNGDTFADFDVYLHDIMSNQQMKTELDQYLEESLMPRSQDFDVLGWWRINRSKYPTLSKMASDILSIPVSTVTPDSVFDTVPRDLDRNRSSLRPITLEAISCAKDWLQYESWELPYGIPTATVKMEY
ncbi:zinc finger BED domain-containing protein DAYSLEEPER-like [Lycium ferocissimum]|uniref:zinc finger BED domain-containing protein DAYSLEEPER-like n=1 Tax=Lycium ferocissimum TaxID=112874 RepID=UPI002815DB3F|nr:zinc finger BED domain-containing protein DAYSLEEPER-like [Lycium ferocissimum]XP_059291261.1 zinc finger BED domain-containing protein DAYSLEEPER-like [Lycium ferocissimum]